MSKQKLAKAESSCQLKPQAWDEGHVITKLVLLGWRETLQWAVGELVLCAATVIRGLGHLFRGLCVTLRITEFFIV